MTKKINNQSTRSQKAVGRISTQKYEMSLYVTGLTSRSLRAVENIKKICEEHLKGRYELDVVDIYRRPELAQKEQIIAAPTLVKKSPFPLRRFIGDMSRTEKILRGLGLLIEVKRPVRGRR